MIASDNTKSILAMMLAMAGFILNDAMAKLVSDDLPLGQIIFVRGCFCLVFMFAACQVTGVFRKAQHLANPYVSLRALAELFATLLYLSALFRMPIANATAILQILPLAVTAGAAMFLKSPVGWRRWTAIVVGFTGVLFIVRPGLEGFNSWSIVALIAVFCMAGRDLATRKLPADVPTLGVALVSFIGVSVFGGILTIWDGWQPVSLQNMVYLAGSAVFIVIGFIFIIIAMRGGDIAVVAPFRYTIVLWALLLGYVVWGDIPDAFTLFGTIVIVSTGVYTFFRERRT